MAKASTVALALIAAAIAAPSAAQDVEMTMTAPTGTAETRYCLQIEATTGTRLEAVKCRTREQWAEQDVDVDAEWASEGVRTIG